MTKLIEFLISGCWHKWVRVASNAVWDDRNHDAKRPIGYVTICECSRCGMPKRFNLY